MYTRNTVCSPRRTCQAGQYFGCSVCTNCKPGMYGTNGRFCHTCADGTFSTGGATYCTPVRTMCPYGQWESAGALPGRVSDITCRNCIETDTKCGTSGDSTAQPGSSDGKISGQPENCRVDNFNTQNQCKYAHSPVGKMSIPDTTWQPEY